MLVILVAVVVIPVVVLILNVEVAVAIVARGVFRAAVQATPSSRVAVPAGAAEPRPLN